MTLAIDIGTTAAGAPATLDLEELLSTRLLVQGNSGSGKSHLLRRLLEQSAPWVQQVVLDPEGDFVTLAERFGHLVVDAAAQEERALQRAAERIRAHRVSVVLDLEGLDAEGQMRRAAAFLNGLFEVERDHWTPALVAVDEAQVFAPAGSTEVPDDARRASLAAMTNLMCRGRKRGLAGVIATQRLAKLAKNVAAEASNFLMGRTFLDIDMARAADLLGMERRQAESFRDLARGQFVALGPALSRRPLTLRIGAVQTATRTSNPTLDAPPPAATEAVREMILASPPEPAAPRRRAPAPPPPDILAQLAAARPAPLHDRAAAEPAQITLEDAADRARRLDEVLREVLADPEAAFRPVAVLFNDFLVRCRIRAVPGKPMDLADFRARLATARAGVSAEDAHDDDWTAARRRAETLPEDLRGVFLLLARAALDRAPCPSDATLAAAYGTRSLGRARRLLAYLEERNAIVCRTEKGGRRVVALVELAWETAPGDAEAA